MISQTNNPTTPATRHFAKEIAAIKRDAIELRSANHYTLQVLKWRPIQDIRKRIGELEADEELRHFLEPHHHEKAFHQMDVLVEKDADATLFDTDPVTCDKLDRDIARLEAAFAKWASEDENAPASDINRGAVVV
jgi:hypothetical protein